jgi:hypothetical protein
MRVVRIAVNHFNDVRVHLSLSILSLCVVTPRGLVGSQVLDVLAFMLSRVLGQCTAGRGTHRCKCDSYRTAMLTL